MPEELPISDDDLESRIRPAEPDELPILLDMDAEETEMEEAPQPIILEEEEEPISLVEEAVDAAEELKSKVKQISHSAIAVEKTEYKRPLNQTGQGATRCRVFHSRIAAEALDNMQDKINEWLDSEEIDVKHIGHVIGTMEGKTPRPNVIVMVWY